MAFSLSGFLADAYFEESTFADPLATDVAFFQDIS